MLGAIVGDLIGSIYEGSARLSKNSTLLSSASYFTDDSLFTLATADALMSRAPADATFRRWGRKYPTSGTGRLFTAWLVSDTAGPYEAVTNGALMRVSPAVALASNLGEALHQSRAVTEITHNSPRALQAVEAYARALWAAMTGGSIGEVLFHLQLPDEETIGLDALHEAGIFRMNADQTLHDVRQCLEGAADFESTMRNCVYCGGDVDTLCAVAGALAEVLWGVPLHFASRVSTFLPADLMTVMKREYICIRSKHRGTWAKQLSTLT